MVQEMDQFNDYFKMKHYMQHVMSLQQKTTVLYPKKKSSRKQQ